MLKQHKKKLLISSLLILLPILVGLLLWNQLPDTMATHWGADGQVDGWSSKLVAICVHPILLLLTHWLCIWVTFKDPGQKNQSRKVSGMVFWLMPLVSLFSSALLFGTALGSEVSMGSIIIGMVGLIFLVVGNYLPKVKQNYTIGIKVVWALHNEENWNATHRFGGKVWVVGGLATILLMFFPMEKTLGLIMAVLTLTAVLPILYSYLYYKKQCAQGGGYPLTGKPMNPAMKKVTAGAGIATVVILVMVSVLLFTGEIRYSYSADSFTVDPSQWNGLTVKYDTIETIEYREEAVSGSREYGYGSFRLLLGSFKNEEFGMFTRYTYTSSEACVVLRVKGKILVLAGETIEDTQHIYQEISSRMEG